MNEENTQKLTAIAPWMFRLAESTEPFYPIHFGFECGDGWFRLLEDLLTKLARIDTKNEITILQIKEKFGGLRFYINSVPLTINEHVESLITEAEELALKTCEMCGARGRSRNGGWIVVLCDKCYEAKQ